MFDESDDFSSDSERGADSGDDWVPGDDIIHKEVNIEGRPAGDIVNDDEDADQAEEEVGWCWRLYILVERNVIYCNKVSGRMSTVLEVNQTDCCLYIQSKLVHTSE